MNATKSFARLCAGVILIGSSACAIVGRGGQTRAARADLTGSWMLNEAASSDTARASVRGLEQDVRATTDRGVTDTRPRGTYGERLRAARMDGELAARVLAAARNAIEQLTIADSAGVITLRAGEHAPVVITPNGRTAEQVWLDGTSAALRARWVAQRLEVVRRLGGGITVQEYYSRSPGGSRLVVFTIVRGPFDGELTLRRVYDAVS